MAACCCRALVCVRAGPVVQLQCEPFSAGALVASFVVDAGVFTAAIGHHTLIFVCSEEMLTALVPEAGCVTYLCRSACRGPGCTRGRTHNGSLP